jgi:hypothetical protein
MAAEEAPMAADAVLHPWILNKYAKLQVRVDVPRIVPVQHMSLILKKRAVQAKKADAQEQGHTGNITNKKINLCGESTWVFFMPYYWMKNKFLVNGIIY